MLDQARAATKDVSLPAQRGISLGIGNYVVSVGLGTPARDMTVMFDTGTAAGVVDAGGVQRRRHEGVDAPVGQRHRVVQPLGQEEPLPSRRRPG
jgi:hypothetical protein